MNASIKKQKKNIFWWSSISCALLIFIIFKYMGDSHTETIVVDSNHHFSKKMELDSSDVITVGIQVKDSVPVNVQLFSAPGETTNFHDDWDSVVSGTHKFHVDKLGGYILDISASSPTTVATVELTMFGVK